MNSVFKDNKNLKEYWETSDGTPFYTENMAKNHASGLEDKNVKHVERSESESESDSKQKSAADILALVPDMDLETAKEYLEADKALDKPRKSVVEALEARIAELEKGA